MTSRRLALVTGASGFLGRHLLRALLAQGREVLALCRHPKDLEDLAHPSLEVIAGSVEQTEILAPHLSDANSVFHLAAARFVPGISPETLRRVNEVATLNLSRAAALAGVPKFIHVSTAMVFGPSQGESLDEDSPSDWQTIDNPYIRSRARAQEEMKRLARRGLPLAIVCPTVVFGPDHRSHPNRITDQIRFLLRTGLDLVIGDGSPRRNLVYVQDVVRGMLLAEAHHATGEVFILGGQDCSHREFNRMTLSLGEIAPRLSLSIPMEVATPLARLADKVRGFHRRVNYTAALQTLTQEWCYTSRKAERLLGYTRRPLKEAILDTLTWIQGSELRECG